jgi:hypothetical protein
MNDLPPLTPEQQPLMDQYRLLNKTFWEAHDAYSQIHKAWKKAQAACLAAGFGPTSYLGPIPDPTTTLP